MLLSGSCTIASEKSETCFALPLRKAIAHFARRNARSAETEMGNAHTRIDKSADFGVA